MAVHTAQTVFHADEITARFPALAADVARAFARAASHPTWAAEADVVMSEVDEDAALEAAEDLAWAWAHGTGADVAHQAYQAIPGARRERDGSYSAPLVGGGCVVWGGDETREGEPVPAVDWAFYDEEGDAFGQDAWIGGAARVEPSVSPMIEALRASARALGARLAS